MGRNKNKPSDEPPEGPDSDLSETFHTRISEQAGRLLRDKARKAGLLPATFGRLLLYRGLGLLPDETAK